jgi:pimeloyl-ACP methyl ester carboxylesterase
MAFEKKTIDLGAGTIPYFVGGPSGRDEGRPLVYFHPGGGVIFTKVVEQLAEKFQVFAPVFPGFDGTPLLDGVSSIRALAEMCAEFVDKTVGTDDKVDVVGHSFGGWVACWYAALHGDRVDQLVLECPAGFRQPGEGGLSDDPDERLRQLYRYPEKAPPETRTPEEQAGNGAAIGHYYQGQGTGYDEELLGKLKNLDCLTLIVHGTLDTVIPASTARLLKETIPGAYLTFVYDAAHSVEVDQPERMMRVVDAFLQRAEGFLVNWGDEEAA